VIEIDGSMGEGGGQIVRTALALSMCTGAAVTVHGIRARRSRPGLRAQHLAAVRAATRICGARATGAAIGSSHLIFEPQAVEPGTYEVDVGTAGSAMLVLETLLPALSLCSAPSELLLHGGTHNPRAPTYEFVRDAYLPLLGRLGFRAQIAIDRYGFYPRGGGLVRARVEPRVPRPALDLLVRGAVTARSVNVLLAGLPEHVAQREIGVLRDRLGIAREACSTSNVAARGAGNAVHVRIDCTGITTIFAGFGIRGVPAEQVADRLAHEVEQYLGANVAVDAHLADQLLLPLAIAAGGEFSSLRPTTHTTTNAAVIRQFLGIDYEARELPGERSALVVRPRAISPARPLPLSRR
jgi:RNA 3'-terminal phosphate cyclase (ATP)